MPKQKPFIEWWFVGVLLLIGLVSMYLKYWLLPRWLGWV